MPIEIWAVEKPVFDEWAAMAKEDADKAQEWIQSNHNPAGNTLSAEPVMSAPALETQSPAEPPVTDQPPEQEPTEQPHGSSE